MSIPINLLTPPDPSAPIKITPRERTILVQIANGATNGRVGKRLHISEHTVKFHMNTLLYKFGVHTRAHLVATALRKGIIQ